MVILQRLVIDHSCIHLISLSRMYLCSDQFSCTHCDCIKFVWEPIEVIFNLYRESEGCSGHHLASWIRLVRSTGRISMSQYKNHSTGWGSTETEYYFYLRISEIQNPAQISRSSIKIKIIGNTRELRDIHQWPIKHYYQAPTRAERVICASFYLLDHELMTSQIKAIGWWS